METTELLEILNGIFRQVLKNVGDLCHAIMNKTK